MNPSSAPGNHVTSGSVRIHYQDTGEGPPILVPNGWSASGLIWPDEWIHDLELPGVGHLVPWEEPRRTAGAMREFFASAPAVPSTKP